MLSGHCVQCEASGQVNSGRIVHGGHTAINTDSFMGSVIDIAERHSN